MLCLRNSGIQQFYALQLKKKRSKYALTDTHKPLGIGTGQTHNFNSTQQYRDNIQRMMNYDL